MSTLHLPAVLEAHELAVLRRVLVTRDFAAGRATAAALAGAVKQNVELVAHADPELAAAGKIVERALRRHPALLAWSLPRRVSTVIFNRYDAGMAYGDHVDNALAESSGGGFFRMDISFTVFLADPTDYDGGELVIGTDTGAQPVKLAAGDAVIYAASTLHRVNPVTTGSRLCAVGWIESLVRDPARREILFDLHRVSEDSLAHDVRLRVEKCRANLLRMWADA